MKRAFLGTLALVALMSGWLAFAGPAGAALKGEQVRVKVKVNKQVSATVRTGDSPIRLSVRLNGRRISGLFAARPAIASTVPLGRGDGLRYGKNRLRVKALFASGRTRTSNRTFRIRVKRPIADAGPNRRSFGGDRIKLSGAGTKAKGRSMVRYRWKIVSRPRGSKARLKNAGSKRPRLLTDRGGAYRVRVSARSGRGPIGTDMVQINATDPKLTRAGTFVSTAPFGAGAADGPATSLEILSGSSAGSYPIGKSQPGPVVTLFFHRATMGLIAGPVYTGVGAADATRLQNLFASAQQTTGQTPMVISAGNNYGSMSNQFRAWLNGTLNANGIGNFAPSSFALAGVGTGQPLAPGAPPPSGVHLVSGDTSAKGRLSGQILPDAAQNWSFVPSSLPAFGSTSIPFDTATPADAIEIAGQTYPEDPRPAGCPDASGFQVLAVDAKSAGALEPLSTPVTVDGRTFENGDTFWTNSCAFNANTADQESRFQQQAMLGVLNAAQGGNQPAALVFVQSVGNVAPSVTTPDSNFNIWIDQIATSLARLGGSEGTFLGLFGGAPTGYSLVGQNFTTYGSNSRVSEAEVATNMPTSPPARQIGILRFDPAGSLIPGISSAAEGQRAAGFKQSLPQSELARQMDTTTWKRTPFPNQNNPAWVAALQDLAEAAGLTYNPDLDVPCYRPPGGKSDVRSNYCGGVTEGENPDTYWTNSVLPVVKAAPYEQNSSYTETEFESVKSQLEIEFKLVDAANEASNALSQSFSTAQSNDSDAITQQYVSAVQQAERSALLEARPADLGWVGEIFDLAAAVTGFVSDGISGVLWVTSASLANEGNLVTDGKGQSLVTGLKGTLSGSPEQAAASVQSQISDQVSASNAVRFALADSIVSDWGRLQEATDDLANVPDTEALANSADAIRLGGIRYVWSDLLRSSTTLFNIDDSSINNYNPTGNGLQPAYDLGFTKNYGCWLSGTGVFKDGESIEKVFGDATAGSVYSDPHNLFSWQRWDSYSPYVLTVGGINPSGSGSNPPPSPASQYYAAILPDAVINPFSAAQPSPGSAINPVVNGGPPGLGYSRSQLFDRLFLERGQSVTCHGPGSL